MSKNEGDAECDEKIRTPTQSGLPPAEITPAVEAPQVDSPESAQMSHADTNKRRWLLGAGVGIFVLAVTLYFLIPWLVRAFTTVSTDDAYVAGHVTFVAARVPGQVVKVRVDDNNRVHQGDLLVELDQEPYQVQLDIKDAELTKAHADLQVAISRTQSMVAQARGQRWKLQHAMEAADSQVALLRAKVAALGSRKAELKLAQANFERAKGLINRGAIASEEYDRREKAVLVARDEVEAALAETAQIRVNLGLRALSVKTSDLAQVPANINQIFSSVRQAQSELIEIAAQLGVVHSFVEEPKQMLEDFEHRAPQGDIDRLLAGLVNEAPAVKQARAKLLQVERDLEQAKLNLRYCNVIAEIDGVITRRNVNPGNNVLAGQGLMAIRSLSEIWVDANFKETQLAELRIGQPVDLYVDMYGRRRVFHGHISGFTMGTGSTLALLPAENATGNFVKVVQRLPVRIDLDDYDPEEATLFIGLSVVPYVYVNRPPVGANAGKHLQQQPPAGSPVRGPANTLPEAP